MSRLNVDQIYTRTGTGTPAIREMPAFSVYRSTNQSLVTGTVDFMEYDVVDYDTNGWWSENVPAGQTPPGLYRYTPQIPGYYQFNATSLIIATSLTLTLGTFYKNYGAGAGAGEEYFRGWYLPSYNNNIVGSNGSALFYLNGSTDFVQFTVYVNSAATSVVASSSNKGDNSLQGFLVRPD